MNKADKLLQITAFSVGFTILKQRIIEKDDIEYVTEFPCLLGHPVHSNNSKDLYRAKVDLLVNLGSPLPSKKKHKQN